MKVGDIVWYWFDTGRSHDVLYGVVVAAGPKTYTVRWESGTRNRIRHDRRDVKLVQPDRLDEARRALGREGV